MQLQLDEEQQRVSLELLNKLLNKSNDIPDQRIMKSKGASS